MSWFFGEDFDLVADMRADLPWRVAPGASIFFSLDTRTNILSAGPDFAFLVQDVDYAGEVGARSFAGRGFLRGVRSSVFVGQQGRQRVDAEGHAWVRYLGVGFESSGYRSLADGVQWRLAAGAVLEDREIEADAVFRGGLRLRPRVPPPPYPVGLLRRLGLDAVVDAVPAGGRFRADWRVGPSLWLRADAARRLSIFAHYLESENPLGLGSSGWLLGLDFSEGGAGRRPRFTPPDVSGTIGTGTGSEERLAGIFGLRMLSPALSRRGVYLAGEFEGNVLAGADIGEIYWLYHVGVEQRRGSRTFGAWFYHRSNHKLGEANDRITFTNVIEVGVDSMTWGRAGRHGVPFALRLHAGYLVSSTFGENRRWHLHGGFRWAPVRRRSLEPFVLAEAEAGDVERYLAAIGIAVAENVDLRVEYRDDQQYFAAEQTATLLVVRAGF